MKKNGIDIISAGAPGFREACKEYKVNGLKEEVTTPEELAIVEKYKNQSLELKQERYEMKRGDREREAREVENNALLKKIDKSTSNIDKSTELIYENIITSANFIIEEIEKNNDVISKNSTEYIKLLEEFKNIIESDNKSNMIKDFVTGVGSNLSASLLLSLISNI